MAEVRDLTDEERTILDVVIRNAMSEGVNEALAQLAVARHGGPSHGGNDVCFLINLPTDVPLIPNSVKSPVGLSEWPHDQIVMGDIDIFISAGRLSSVDLSEVTEPDPSAANTRWPALENIVIPHRDGIAEQAE